VINRSIKPYLYAHNVNSFAEQVKLLEQLNSNDQL